MSGSTRAESTVRPAADMETEAEEAIRNMAQKGLTLGRNLINEAYSNVDVTIDGNMVRDLTRPGLRRDRAVSVVDKYIDSLSTATKAQQITAGGVSGWLTGYLFNKFGKPVLYMMGSTIILVMIAEHQGYLSVDWTKFRQDYDAGRRFITEKLDDAAESTGFLSRKNGRPWLIKLRKLASTSPYITGGFLGGVLLGLAS